MTIKLWTSGVFGHFVCVLQGGATGDTEGYMVMAKDAIEQMKSLAVDLRQQGHPNDNLVRT